MEQSLRIWRVRKQDPTLVDRIAREGGISPVTAKVLLNRGIDTPEAVRAFLCPETCVFSPFLMKDMDKAVERLLLVRNKKEKIVIYGDYDVDGTTSIALLVRFFYAIGIEADFYIPDRMSEGYGLNREAITDLARRGYHLVVTVDCGITAVEEVRLAADLGLDVIITDHHLPGETLPPALAVINPKRADCPYPFKELAGVGVAYKLCAALAEKLGVPDLLPSLLDIVALGTVADVVPLRGENRYYVLRGLEFLNRRERVGLTALLEEAGLRDRRITATHIAFALAPRLNAAGRIGSALKAAELLLCEDPGRSAEIARQLNSLNQERQAIEDTILQEAISLLPVQVDPDDRVFVLAREGWHHGVIGIVASRLVERFNRPTILIGLENGEGRGSGRSIEGFHLHQALTAAEEYLSRFGGHAMAAGLSLPEKNIAAFRRRINEYAEKQMDPRLLLPSLWLDDVLNPGSLTAEVVAELNRLEPFGAGNPSPLFLCPGMEVQNVRAVGGDKHAKLNLACEGVCVEAIAFRQGQALPEMGRLAAMDVACSLEINSWNGQENVQLVVRDWRVAGPRAQQFYSPAFWEMMNDCPGEFPPTLPPLVTRQERWEKLLAICGNTMEPLILHISHPARAEALLARLSDERPELLQKITLLFPGQKLPEEKVVREEWGKGFRPLLATIGRPLPHWASGPIISCDVPLHPSHSQPGATVYLWTDEDWQENMTFWQDLPPDREQLAEIYLFIKQTSKGLGVGERDLFHRFQNEFAQDISFARFSAALLLFLDAGLLTVTELGDEQVYQLTSVRGKVDILGVAWYKRIVGFRQIFTEYAIKLKKIFKEDRQGFETASGII